MADPRLRTLREHIARLAIGDREYPLHVVLAEVDALEPLFTDAMATTARRWLNSHADDGEAEEALARALQEWLDD